MLSGFLFLYNILHRVPLCNALNTKKLVYKALKTESKYLQNKK